MADSQFTWRHCNPLYQWCFVNNEYSYSVKFERIYHRPDHFRKHDYGPDMAPSYTNLFIGKFECKLVRTQTALSLVWWRFIDDVFANCTHGEQPLQMFLLELNHHHTSIKFTANFWQRRFCSWTLGSTSRMDDWRWICVQNWQTNISTSTQKAAILGIARQLSPSSKHLDFGEFALNRITYRAGAQGLARWAIAHPTSRLSKHCFQFDDCFVLLHY